MICELKPALSPIGSYCVERFPGFTPIDGTPGEWRSIAAAIRKRERLLFDRCAVAGAGVGKLVTIWSPRNARSVWDHIELTAAEADAFAAHIDQLFAASEVPT